MGDAGQTGKFNHFNVHGDAHMVDVGHKPATHRVAVAEGYIEMLPDTLQMVQAGSHKKGDVLAVARLAGIMAAKKTSELVPLCHPVALTHLNIEFSLDNVRACIHCTATAETNHVTGVEMEALTAVQIALLTIYDMCKGIDRGMHMQSIRLLQKSGGQSGDWQREP